MIRVFRAILPLVAVLAVLLALTPHASLAQGLAGAAVATGTDEPAADALKTPAEVREAVARLSDEEVRALLLKRLDAEADEGGDPPALEAAGRSLMEGWDGFTAAIALGIEKAPNLAHGIGQGLSRFYVPREAAGLLAFLGTLGLALAAGWLAHRVVLRLAARWMPTEAERTGEAAEAQSLGGQSILLLRRLGVEAAAAAAFLGAAWALVLALAPDAPPAPGRPSDSLILWFLLKQPVLYILAAGAIGRFVLAPRAPGLRLLPLTDGEARFLQLSLVIFAAIAGFRIYALSFLGGHGVNLAEIRFGFWMNIALYGFLLWVVWHSRGWLAESLLRGERDPGEATRSAARLWPLAAMGLIVLFWALTETFVGLELWGLLDGRLALTLLILLFAPAGGRASRWLVERLTPAMTGEGAIAERAQAEKIDSYVRIGRVLGIFLLITVVLALWRVDFAEIAAAGVGAQLAARMVEAVVVLGIGYVIWELVRIRINRVLSREVAEEALDDEELGGEGGGKGGSRLSTVLPLVSMALQAAIVVLTVLVALSTLGVDTTPLLAGAGIVGLAVGFGAQKLVADIVAGIFFLIDDAFRTGEYVEVEGTFGTVEKISIRSLQLRHHEGPVHTIPFGEIPRLTNYSRDWVIMKLRFTVPFETDLEKVRKLFKKIGQELIANELYRDDFLQPFKSQGVLEVDDIGMVIRGKFMAKPGRQWVLRKVIYARVQQVLQENGIPFARREVRVKIDGDHEDLTPAERRQIGAAAAEAAGQGAAPTGGSDGGGSSGPQG